jgi:hypothetical protein
MKLLRAWCRSSTLFFDNAVIRESENCMVLSLSVKYKCIMKWYSGFLLVVPQSYGSSAAFPTYRKL